MRCVRQNVFPIVKVRNVVQMTVEAVAELVLQMMNIVITEYVKILVVVQMAVRHIIGYVLMGVGVMLWLVKDKINVVQQLVVAGSIGVVVTEIVSY